MSQLQVRAAAISFLSFAFFASTVPAAASTGAKGIQDCKDAIQIYETRKWSGSWHAAFAAGNCSGVVRTVLTIAARDPGQRIACPPDKISMRQGLRVVVRYMEQHPQKLHFDLMTLAMEAVQEAFPCSTKPRLPSGLPGYLR